MLALAANFVDFGFTVLMDTVVADRAELDFLLALLAPRPVRLVTLAPKRRLADSERNPVGDPERWEFPGYDRLDAHARVSSDAAVTAPRLKPANRPGNGVRKWIYSDPDRNEIGIGGGPVRPPG